MKSIFLLILLCACAHQNEAQTPKSSERVAELRVKFEEKKLELSPLLAPSGWPLDASDCDGTLWLGKLCAAGVPVDLSLAEYAPGEIHRRPPPSCWTKESGDQGAPSTVSNDMLTGYLACIWTTKDVGALERLADYGEANEVTVLGLPVAWKMGEPYPQMASRVVARPNVLGTVGRMQQVLTKNDRHPGYRVYPAVFGPVFSDFERHIQAESIWLEGEVNDALKAQGDDPVPPVPDETTLIEINDLELSRLKALVKVEPTNFLYHGVLGIYTGDMAPAVELLLDDDTPVPTYVRGGPGKAYQLINWLRAAKIVLDRFPAGA